jgi:hypothetical protein
MKQNFLRLPINADEGFPQAFMLATGDAMYRFVLYVNVAEELLPGPETVMDLGSGVAGVFMVLTVAREDPGGETVLLRRKIVPGLQYQAGDLMLTFTTLRVAVRNLNAVGTYGSEVVGGVAQR